jgi:hypothetical protein
LSVFVSASVGEPIVSVAVVAPLLVDPCVLEKFAAGIVLL